MKMTFDEFDKMEEKLELINTNRIWPTKEQFEMMEKEPNKWVKFMCYLDKKNDEPDTDEEVESRKMIKAFLNKHLELVPSIKYILIKTNTLPIVKEVEEDKFESEIKKILGKYEEMQVFPTDDGDIKYLGSEKKNSRIPNRMLYEWDNSESEIGVVKNEAFIIYREGGYNLTDEEIENIKNIYGQDSIDNLK